MEHDLSVLETKGISTSEGIGFTGGPEKYVSALQRFFKGYGANRASVEGFLAAGDLENYTIKVHAIKSNARMIGAKALGELFEELELAGKSGNADLIKEKTLPALEKYAQTIEDIRFIGEAEPVRAAGELSAPEAREAAEALLEALDEYDDDLSSQLAGKLKGYPFRLTQREKLKEAIADIEDFMYDEAAELIREILPAIEDE